MTLNKAKSVLYAEARKLVSKADQKTREAAKLREEAENLIKRANEMKD